VTGHHRILVIHLVDSTCAGLEWIGAQNQLEYPFALAGALAYKFGYRRADPATTVAQHVARLTDSASRCARSTRLKRICRAWPAQGRVPARTMDHGITSVAWGVTQRRRVASPPAICRRKQRGSFVRRSAGGLNHKNQAMPTHLAVHQPAFIPGNRPLRRRAVRAAPRQRMLPCARASDRERSGEGHA